MQDVKLFDTTVFPLITILNGAENIASEQGGANKILNVDLLKDFVLAPSFDRFASISTGYQLIADENFIIGYEESSGDFSYLPQNQLVGKKVKVYNMSGTSQQVFSRNPIQITTNGGSSSNNNVTLLNNKYAEFTYFGVINGGSLNCWQCFIGSL